MTGLVPRSVADQIRYNQYFAISGLVERRAFDDWEGVRKIQLRRVVESEIGGVVLSGSRDLRALSNKYNNWMKKLQHRLGIAGMESRLSKFSFFTRRDLPGYADGLIFMALCKIQRCPDRQLCPNLYHWYVLMHQFAQSTVSRWIADYIYFDPEDSAIHDFIRILNTPRLEEPSPSPQEQTEDNYILEIISKDNVEQALQNLRRELVGFKVNIIESEHLGDLRVECRLTQERLNELKGLLDRKIEYKYVQSKRRGKTMNAFKETVLGI